MKISCPHCRQNYEVDESYAGQNVQCQNCGNEFMVTQSPILTPVAAPSMKKCPMCGEQILAEARKCKYCGEYLNPDGTVAEKSKSFAVYLILALFFGGIGAHNIYDGKNILGGFKFGITLLGFICLTGNYPPVGILFLAFNTLWVLFDIFTFNNPAKIQK